jgi:hypothetical protein
MDVDSLLLEEPEWKTVETFFALDTFRVYWLENERLIKAAAERAEQRNWPQWTPKTREQYAEFNMERGIARHLHDEIVTPPFRYSCLVMLFAIAERELLRLARNLDKEHQQKHAGFSSTMGSVMKPVAKHCAKLTGVDFSKCKEFDALRDLQIIRDCIVHCRGEVDLFNPEKRPKLIRLTSQRSGFFACAGTEIEVNPPVVDQFTKETWRFFIWLFQQLKWKIDDSWKQSNWAEADHHSADAAS